MVVSSVGRQQLAPTYYNSYPNIFATTNPNGYSMANDTYNQDNLQFGYVDMARRPPDMVAQIGMLQVSQYRNTRYVNIMSCLEDTSPYQ